MLVLSGMYGNYIQFQSEDEAKTFVENLQAMINRNEAPLIFGWSADYASTEDFDKEYDGLKDLFGNEILQAIRQGPTPPSSSGQDT